MEEESRWVHTFCALWNYSLMIFTVPSLMLIGYVALFEGGYNSWVFHAMSGKSIVCAYVFSCLSIMLLCAISTESAKYIYKVEINGMPKEHWKRIQIHACGIETSIVFSAIAILAVSKGWLTINQGLAVSMILFMTAVIQMVPVLDAFGMPLLSELLTGKEAEEVLEGLGVVYKKDKRRKLLDKGLYAEVAALYTLEIAQDVWVLAVIYILLKILKFMINWCVNLFF